MAVVHFHRTGDGSRVSGIVAGAADQGGSLRRFDRSHDSHGEGLLDDAPWHIASVISRAPVFWCRRGISTHAGSVECSAFDHANHTEVRSRCISLPPEYDPSTQAISTSSAHDAIRNVSAHLACGSISRLSSELATWQCCVLAQRKMALHHHRSCLWS